jgi:hypothetical protein
MAYNKKNYFTRIVKVQEIVKREKWKNGLTQKEIYYQFIEPEFHISKRTFYYWLGIPAARELNKLKENFNNDQYKLDI